MELVALCVLVVAVCLQSAETVSSTVRLQSSRNWWESRSNCRQKNKGDLFVLKTSHYPSEIDDILEYDTTYWVGALQYSTWRWTDDQTDLYQHTGYLALTSLKDNLVEHSLSVNSALRCHSICNEVQLIGLSRNKCFCLEKWQLQDSPEATTSEEQCSGHFAEKCGSPHGVSIYKLDNIKFDPVPPGQCAYAIKTGNTVALRATYCSGRRKAACYVKDHKWIFYKCEDNVCITQRTYTRLNADRMFSLLKVTGQNSSNLVHIMEEVQYWVGLHRSITRKWNNGRIFSEGSNKRNVDQSQALCLAMWQNRTHWKLVWRSCETNLEAICEYEAIRSVTPNGLQESTTGAIQESTLESTTDAGQASKWIYTSPMTLLPLDRNVSGTVLRTEDNTKISMGKKRMSMYVGIGIGCVIVVVILLILLIFKRKGMACFKKKEKNHVHYNSATENFTYNLGDSSGNPPVIASTSTHPPLSGNIDASAIPCVARYSYDEGTLTNDPNVSGDIYSQVSHPRNKNDSDQVSNGTVNIVKGNVDNEDVYNLLEQELRLGETDKCYHHLGRTNDDYDVTNRTEQRNFHNDTYNHIRDEERRGTSESEKDKGSTVGNSDNHENLEESNFDNTGETTDYYNLKSSAGVDGCYYNVGAFP